MFWEPELHISRQTYYCNTCCLMRLTFKCGTQQNVGNAAGIDHVFQCTVFMMTLIAFFNSRLLAYGQLIGMCR